MKTASGQELELLSEEMESLFYEREALVEQLEIVEELDEEEEYPRDNIPSP